MALSGKRCSFYNDLDSLRCCFDDLDPGRSGYIGYEELTKLVKNMPNTEDSVVPELMEKLDRDKDGKVSFDDFVHLFEIEREATSKKPKLTTTSLEEQNRSSGDCETSILMSPSDSHYKSAVETFSRNMELSPNSPMGYQLEDSIGGVVLRHNRRRMTMPSKIRPSNDISFLSPIQSGKSSAVKRPPSSDLTDLASQMKYLTDASPQLKRNSKVLSWIESGDFEDTGIGLREAANLPSPSLSSTHGSEEASHVGSILVSVCNSKEIGSDAIAKLCDHVKADPQEQQELLALLNHLDHEKKGYVSVNEFVQGLEAVKNSANVSASTPTGNILRRTYSDVSPPRLSEPFSTPSKHGSKSLPLSSTPMIPASLKNTSILTAIDPDQSGYVNIDDVVTHWQNIGVETPHEQSLETVLTEAVPVDPSGRINISDLAVSLEGSILSEGKSHNVLRQVALKSYKSEISTLRTKIHHVSLERDKLKSSLNRTMDEKQKLITEGDEHVEMISKESERKIKEKEETYMERIKEVERTRQEEALQLQERASNAIKELEEKMEELKGEEEKLRERLKFAKEDVEMVTEQLSLARKEIGKKERIIAMLQKDLGSRSENDLFIDGSHISQVEELETALSEKNELVSELQDKLRQVQDTCDELKAENERMKQKHFSQKRSMQKSKTIQNPSATNSKKRHPNRPLSGSHFHRRSMPLHPRVPTSMDLDLAVQKQDHPILLEVEQEDYDYFAPIEVPESEGVPRNEVETLCEKSSDDEELSESEDNYAKSSASLKEELQHNERWSKDLEEEHSERVAQLKDQLARLEEFGTSQQDLAIRLKEEKTQMKKECIELQYSLTSERKSHEVEVNILSRKLENAENDVIKLESNLEQMKEERMHSKKQYESKLASAQKNAELEVAALKDELLHISSDYSTLNAQLKEKLDSQKEELTQESSDAIAMLEDRHAKQIEAVKSKHDAIAKKLHEDLNAMEHREKVLQDKLSSSTKELKIVKSQLDDLHEREETFNIQITELEAKEAMYVSEISQLKADTVKLQEEVMQMKSAAVVYKNKISSLKAELQKETEYDNFSPLQSNSRRSSTSSTSSKHGEIITKMRSQLEELQKVLESKAVNDEDNRKRQDFPEIDLIHKLLSDSTALDTEVQKMRRKMSAERLSHLQECSQKDENFRNLQVEKDRQSMVIKGFASDLSRHMFSQMETFLSTGNDSISKSTFKIDEAILKLTTIYGSLKDRDTSHMDALLSNLNQPHHEINSYKDEIDRLQSELETSHQDLDELSQSKDQLTRLHRAQSAEIDKLRLKLQQVSSDNFSSLSVKVDADSSQVIADQDESQTRDEVILQKDETIHALENELEVLKHTERRIRALNEEAYQKISDREKEIRETMESLQRQARELKLKLEQQEHEHVTEMNSTKEVIAKNRAGARALYSYLLGSGVGTRLPGLSHSQLMTGSMNEITKIKEQLTQQQHMCSELESTLAGKMEECELLETQITAEHEEEVRALRQQKQQLIQQLDELKENYQNILDDQEQESAMVINELENTKIDAEKQLKEKTEESLHIYQQVADLIQEKKVLVDIMKQLCIEVGRHIDIV